MTAITAFALATRALTLPEPVEIAGLVAMTALAFPAAAHGVARARRGDGTVPPWAAHRMTAATVRPPRRSRPFGSAERAQIWFELRRNGTMAILFFLMMTAIMLPTLLLPSQHIDLVDVFIAPVPFLTTAVFLALQVLWFGIAGGNLARPDAWKPALEPSAFLAARAMSDRQLISAKVKASAVVVVFAWAIVLGLVGLSMLVPHGAPRSETLAHFLRRHATPQGIGMAAAAIAGLVLLSWLAVLKSFAVTLYGRQWITHARVYRAVLLICGLAVAAHWAWLHRESPVLFLAARVVVWALIAAKVGTAMLIVFATRRGGIARGGRLIAWTATWLLATAALFGLTFWLAPGVRHSPAALAATIVLVVPFNRLIAMPLAWHHNRHR